MTGSLPGGERGKGSQVRSGPFSRGGGMAEPGAVGGSGGSEARRRVPRREDLSLAARAVEPRGGWWPRRPRRGGWVSSSRSRPRSARKMRERCVAKGDAGRKLGDQLGGKRKKVRPRAVKCGSCRRGFGAGLGGGRGAEAGTRPGRGFEADEASVGRREEEGSGRRVPREPLRVRAVDAACGWGRLAGGGALRFRGEVGAAGASGGPKRPKRPACGDGEGPAGRRRGARGRRFEEARRGGGGEPAKWPRAKGGREWRGGGRALGDGTFPVGEECPVAAPSGGRRGRDACGGAAGSEDGRPLGPRRRGGARETGRPAACSRGGRTPALGPCRAPECSRNAATHAASPLRLCVPRGSFRATVARPGSRVRGPPGRGAHGLSGRCREGCREEGVPGRRGSVKGEQR